MTHFTRTLLALPLILTFAIIGHVLLNDEGAFATNTLDGVEQKAGIDERLDQPLDLNLSFTDETGRTGKLRDFLISGRPAIVVPVYFTCPQLCTYTQTGVSKLLNQLDLALGADFKVLSVSFRADDTPADAHDTAAKFRAMLKRPEAGTGWSFLTGTSDNVAGFMQGLGFHYTKDGEQFMHAAALVVLTPEGRISRYFYGIEFNPADVRFSLVEAAKGKIGTTLDRFLMYCFRFDSMHGKYTLAIMNVVRVICLTVAVFLVFFLLRLRRAERASDESIQTADA